MAFPVADTISGVFGAMAIMIAVYERDRNPDGVGQYIDIALYESIFRLMELPPIAFDQLGIVTQRTGAQSTYVAPVNTWKTGDGKWASFTGSTQSMVARLFDAIGDSALIDDPRFCSNEARLANAVELDSLLEKWMLDHTLDEVLEKFEAHDLAIAPVLSIEDIFSEDHFWQRGALIEHDDPDLGPVRSPGIMPKFSRTPGAIRWLGRRLDDDRGEILNDWLGESAPRE
jgi:crotonobetainyl-CoA:carnitine CoA-transferase CaiB-like acyl-CoA transferase